MYTEIFIDLETTGLCPNTDEIIEIYALRTDTNEIFHELVKPNKLIPIQSTNVHNITNDMVKDKPSIQTVLEQFKIFCHSSYPILFIGHNAWNFDIKFLKREFKTYNIMFLPYSVFDTLTWLRFKYPSLQSYKLSNLQKHFDVKHINTHRADDDVICLKELIDKLKGESTYSECYKDCMKYISLSRWSSNELEILKKCMIENREIKDIVALFQNKQESSIISKIKYLNRELKNDTYKVGLGLSKKTLEYYQKYQVENKSIDVISKEMSVNESTVIRNLIKCKEYNKEIDLTKIPNYPSDAEIKEIKNFVSSLPEKYLLRTIKSHFGRKYTYNQIVLAIKN